MESKMIAIYNFFYCRSLTGKKNYYNKVKLKPMLSDKTIFLGVKFKVLPSLKLKMKIVH